MRHLFSAVWVLLLLAPGVHAQGDLNDIVPVFGHEINVRCLQKTVDPDGFLSVNIDVLNLTDFYRDVTLQFGIVYDLGGQIGGGELPIALYRNESRTIVKSVHIPVDAKVGKYSFNASLDYRGRKIQANCTFFVSRDQFYFHSKLNSLEREINYLSILLNYKKSQGSNVQELEDRITVLRTSILSAREKLEVKEFQDLGREIGALEKDKELVKEQAYKLNPYPGQFQFFQLLAIFASATTVVLIAVLAVHFLRGHKNKEVRPQKKFDHI